MNYLSMPICYFPSRVLVLCQEEDTAYKSFVKPGSYALCHSVDAAVELLCEMRCEAELLSLQCAHQTQQAKVLASFLGEEDFAALHAEVYNPCRFTELSVAIVDLTCTALNGLTFCQQVGSRQLKKIALVDPADYALAEQALANNFIQAIVIKQGHWLIEVKRLTERLKSVYFLEMSAMIARALPASLPACLYDPGVAAHFAQLRIHYGWVEYYLIASTGVFLVLDEHACAKVVVIQSAPVGSQLTELIWKGTALVATRLPENSQYVEAYGDLPCLPALQAWQENIVSYWQFMQEWVLPLEAEACV